MIFLQANWILAFVCAVTYYQMGRMEARKGRDSAMLWAGLSIVVSALVIRLLGAGWILVVAAQIGLFAAITVIRTLRDS